jgi:hypothetical protein
MALALLLVHPGLALVGVWHYSSISRAHPELGDYFFVDFVDFVDVVRGQHVSGLG